MDRAVREPAGLIQRHKVSPLATMATHLCILQQFHVRLNQWPAHSIVVHAFCLLTLLQLLPDDARLVRLDPLLADPLVVGLQPRCVVRRPYQREMCRGNRQRHWITLFPRCPASIQHSPLSSSLLGSLSAAIVNVVAPEQCSNVVRTASSAVRENGP